jgi:hypothetical protein
LDQPSSLSPSVAPNRFATAGRKGAERVHQLIRQGRLYEQEHGLKRGRQRLRQLIEEGKRYEDEHGLRTGRKLSRRPSDAEVFQTFCDSLLRIVKPRFRTRLLRMIEGL